MKSNIQNQMLLYAEAIKKASEGIPNNIENVISCICECKGKLVITGMGKSGIIARKMAATFASTGTTAIFLHPAEGIHGDLGILSKDDVVIAVSHSGNTQEIISIISYIKIYKIPLITITGNKNSILAKNADFVIDYFIEDNVEPFNLVPTASTTVQLAIGDAIAVTILNLKNFKLEDYAIFHPGGTIGKKLLLKISDIMHSGKSNPITFETADMNEAIMEMTTKGLGCTNIVSKNYKLIGIITDGDLRRFLSKGKIDLSMSVLNTMTANPKRMQPGELAVEALYLMEKYKITMLPIVDENDETVGTLHMHDLIKAGIC